MGGGGMGAGWAPPLQLFARGNQRRWRRLANKVLQSEPKIFYEIVMYLTFLYDFLLLYYWTFRYLSFSFKHFYSSLACTVFQLALKSTSASLDTGPHPARDASSRSPELLLLQGILLLLHSGNQLLQGGRGEPRSAQLH